MAPNTDDYGDRPTHLIDPTTGTHDNTTTGESGTGSGATNPGDEAVSDPVLGRMVGNIRLSEVLGSGGMGRVYGGVDEKLGRTVAVKVIRSNQMLGLEARARFLREAQVLSRLNHPQICQVYDYVEGAENDYLVLELVRGRDLGEAIREEVPRPRALRIALQLAEVLTLTHSRGITHRDLKPENVMLTDAGEIKVLDFGLARQEEEPPEPAPESASSETRVSELVAGGSSVETVLGTVMGTIVYMSPEQARGESASPPSDIYSLGLLLQELFTGEVPYDSRSTLKELLIATAGGESPAADGLPRELANLIEAMKSAEAEDRPTAPEVAERLRWIIDKPRRRLRWIVAIVALTAIIGGSTKYAVDLNRERTAALQAESAALEAREDAEELMTFILQDLHDGLVPLGRLDLLEQVAGQALDYYKSESAGESLTDEGLRRRGTALRNLGGVFTDQGNLEQAVAAYGGSLAIAKDLVVRNPGDLEAVFLLARAHSGMALVELTRDDPDNALASYKEAVNYLRSLIAAEPSNTEWRVALANTFVKMGSLLYTIGGSAEALEVLREAVGVIQSVVDERPDDAALQIDLGDKYRLLSQVLAAIGEVDAARQASDKDIALCLAVARSDAVNASAQLGLMEGYDWRGRLLVEDGDLVAAEEALRSSVRVGERLVADDPTNTHWQFRLSTSYDSLGEALRASGRAAVALDAFVRALDLMVPIAALDSTNAYYQNDLAYSYLQVGKTQAELGRQTQARAAWREGVRVVAAVADEAGLPPIQETYAQALLLLGRVDEARPVVSRVLESGWSLDPATAELCRLHGIKVD